MSTATIRPARPGDASAVSQVVRAAFGDGDPDAPHAVVVSDLVTALDAAGHMRASLVAVRDAAVVGHVQLSHSWLDGRDRLVDVLTLSPLSVLPGEQRRGTGAALVAAALDAARALGAPAVFLEGSPRFYGVRGFERAGLRGFERPSARIPEPAFQVAVLDEGLPPGRLVYVDTFWSLDCVGLRDPDLADVERMLGG